ncbi:MAG: class I SAM-dependent methyltransferase [Collinsella sp.]
MPPRRGVSGPHVSERTKSAAVKKKFQLLHHLEQPCTDEESLVEAALAVHPRKVVIKRPVKGPCLPALSRAINCGQGRSLRCFGAAAPVACVRWLASVNAVPMRRLFQACDVGAIRRSIRICSRPNRAARGFRSRP